MDATRRLLVVASIVAAIGVVVWVAASAEPDPSPKFVDVTVVAAEDVCWSVESGPRDPYDLTEEIYRCGSGTVGYDDDYVAVPSSVVVRKAQKNDAKITASFKVNGDVTETGSTDQPLGTIVLSGN